MHAIDLGTITCTRKDEHREIDHVIDGVKAVGEIAELVADRSLTAEQTQERVALVTARPGVDGDMKRLFLFLLKYFMADDEKDAIPDEGDEAHRGITPAPSGMRLS